VAQKFSITNLAALFGQPQVGATGGCAA